MTDISLLNRLLNLKIIKEHFDNLESRKAELEELILALASPYHQEITIILTVPGFKNTFTAIGVISEIGTNMEAFPSAKHLCSWAGLTPTNNGSAGKENLSGFPRSDATSNLFLCSAPTLRLRVNSILKFVMATFKSRNVAVIRSNHCYCKDASYRIVPHAQEWQNYSSDLYKKSDVLPTTREITVKQAILMDQFQDYCIKSATE